MAGGAPPPPHRLTPAPPQVSFPDVEKAEWLNKVSGGVWRPLGPPRCPPISPAPPPCLPQILAQAWPFFGQFMEKLLVENVAPNIRASNTHLQTFSFTKVDLGEKVRGGPVGSPPPAPS